MKREHDIEGQLYLLSSEQGGRKTPACSGYRPHHKLHDNYQTSGQCEFLNVTMVAPGETASTKVWLLSPDVYPNSLWVGREIGVFEGNRKIGILTVTCILNEVLTGNAETYNPIWVMPAGLDASGKRIVG